MITMTEAAKNQLDFYFSDKPKTSIRIYLSESGRSGSRLALIMDEPVDGDDILEVNGYTFVVEKELLKKAKPLTLHLGYTGFQIHSNMKLGYGRSQGQRPPKSCCG